MKNLSPAVIGFLQGLGLSTYIFLVASVMWNAEKWFGRADTFLTPVLVLTLLSFSVLVCGFLALGYPIKLFWIKKEPQKAIKIVAHTTLFLFVFLAIIFGVLTLG